MKYEPDIARQILKAMESHESAELPFGTNLLPDIDVEVYFFHSGLLEEAGYISTFKIRFQGGVAQFWPRKLKWPGVQFLEMFKDETFWQRAKNEATGKEVGMALDTLTRIGTDLMMKIIGGAATA